MFLRRLFVKNRQVQNPVHRSANALGRITTQRLTECDEFRAQYNNVQGYSSYCVRRGNAPAPIRLAPAWGFVIYRCTYEDDVSWNKFIATWKSTVVSEVRRFYKNGEQLANTFNMVIKDDRMALDNASAETVRVQHMAWARSDPSYVACLAGHGGYDAFWTRYEYCVRVDTEALQSCLRYMALPNEVQRKYIVRGKDNTLGQTPYVDVITCQVVPLYDASGSRKVVENICDGEKVAIKSFFPEVMTDVYCEINDELFDKWLAGRGCDQYGVVHW